MQDHSISRRSAIDFFQLRRSGDPQTIAARAARLANQFLLLNRSLLKLLDVLIELDYDGSDLHLRMQAGSAVGAIPLLSPFTSRPDYGLVVQPRFPWPGIGPMLAEMGWRISPTPLRLPLLLRSERRVPLWVLSFMILVRLQELLKTLNRRFELATEKLPAPRGTVHWAEYAGGNLPHAKFLSVPCTFPDLRDDRLLKGAVHYSIERQLRALETQKEHGAFVHRLLEFAQQLRQQVQSAPIYIPSNAMLSQWLRSPIRTDFFIDGLQAIEWTLDERGLAGLSDLEGIPWTMPMERFFEAWVETIFQKVARRTGALMRIGRNRETVHAIEWNPPYLGSQKALIPDIWLESEGATLIVDAKYKRHWEEMQQQSWGNLDEIVREAHRSDLFQILAYANLAKTSKVIGCLIYPCTNESWHSLRTRGRLFHHAQISAGKRQTELWITAVPIAEESEQVAEVLADRYRNAAA